MQATEGSQQGHKATPKNGGADNNLSATHDTENTQWWLKAINSRGYKRLQTWSGFLNTTQKTQALGKTVQHLEPTG